MKLKNLSFTVIAIGSLSLIATAVLAKQSHNSLPLRKKHHRRISMVKPIYVKKDQKEITVTLPANATTGYSWYLVGYDHELIEPEKSKYIPPTSQLAGAPGKMTFTFEIDEEAFVVPRMSRITLIYARPWDIKGASVKVIPVVFQ